MSAMELEHLNHGEVVTAGLLAQVLAKLTEIERALADDRLSFDADMVQTVTWKSGGTEKGYADVELGKMFRGVSIFNLDSVNDVRVGFASTLGNAAGNNLLVVSPRGFITLPILTSHVSVGGAGGTAGVLLVALNHAPPISGGKF